MQIIETSQVFLKEAIEADRMRNMTFKRKNTHSETDWSSTNENRLILKGLSDDNADVLIVDGAWKNLKKKGSMIAAVGWGIEVNGRIVCADGQRVQAVNAGQSKMKAILAGMQKAVSLQVRCLTILTDWYNSIKALREFPECRLELVSICSEIRMIVDSFEHCSIVKCSRNRVKFAHDLAQKARKYG